MGADAVLPESARSGTTHEPPSDLTDALLAALARRGHPMEAICLYLVLPASKLRERIAALGLAPPPSGPLRLGSGASAWSVADVRGLVAGIRAGLGYRGIGERIGRSTDAVAAKARRLGLGCGDGSAREVSPCSARPRVRWTETKDGELAERWFAGQRHEAIARDMGISAAAVRSRATRLGLPPRDRADLVDCFDRERSASSPLRASLVRRRCPFTGIAFWSTRNGPRMSPLARASRRFRSLGGGLPEAHACVAA